MLQKTGKKHELSAKFYYLIYVFKRDFIPDDRDRKKLKNLFLNSQPDAPIIQIYSVIKLYMFRASSLPIIRSFLLYIRHW